MLTDPIADMLTRIRNGGMARMREVSVPASRLKGEIARLLQETGYITGYRTEEVEGKPFLMLSLRYDEDTEPIIGGIERVSRPSRRVYVGAKEVPQVRAGLGVAIMSTPRGILTDSQARDANVGGEILARVW